MLTQAHRLLNRTYPLAPKPPADPAQFWQSLAETYGRAYVSFFWQKLV